MKCIGGIKNIAKSGIIEERIRQRVEYEKVPAYCNNYCRLGHNQSYFKQMSAPKDGEYQDKKKELAVKKEQAKAIEENTRNTSVSAKDQAKWIRN